MQYQKLWREVYQNMPLAMSRVIGKDYSQYLVIDTIDGEILEEAKEIFQKYVNNGVIINSSFDDDEWLVTDEKSKTWISFSYSEIEYEKHAGRWIGCSSQCFKEAVKSYILFNFGLKVLSTLKALALSFCHLTTSDLPDENGFGVNSGQISKLLQIIPGFSEERNAAIECLEDCATLYNICKTQNQRKLLDFASYFKFHDALNDYWKDANEEDRCFYFPIYLWWNLTAILPLRVTEFLLTPKECLLQKENGEYQIIVRRTRLKRRGATIAYNIEQDYEKKMYPVSAGIAHEILWYKDNTKNLEPSSIDTLFCIGAYKERHKSPYPNTSIFAYSQMNRLKADFYRNVLKGKDIPVVDFGDTRHIAMINLIISGGSPRMCMELAGHSRISISSHYYSNMASLVECFTYEMYRRAQKGTAAVINGNDLYSMMPVTQLIQIPNGWCSSPKRKLKQVDDCILAMNSLGEIGDCKSCQYYRRDVQGKHLDFYDIEQGKQKVVSDSWFLMHMIEAVRQGIGCEESIRQAILRLQQSCNHYRQCLWNQYVEDNNGKTQKD